MVSFPDVFHELRSSGGQKLLSALKLVTMADRGVNPGRSLRALLHKLCPHPSWVSSVSFVVNTYPSLFAGSYFAVSQIRAVAPTIKLKKN